MSNRDAVCFRCKHKLSHIVHMHSIAGEAACEFYPSDRKTWLAMRAEGFERPEPEPAQKFQVDRGRVYEEICPGLSCPRQDPEDPDDIKAKS